MKKLDKLYEILEWSDLKLEELNSIYEKALFNELYVEDNIKAKILKVMKEFMNNWVSVNKILWTIECFDNKRKLFELIDTATFLKKEYKFLLKKFLNKDIIWTLYFSSYISWKEFDLKISNSIQYNNEEYEKEYIDLIYTYLSLLNFIFPETLIFKTKLFLEWKKNTKPIISFKEEKEDRDYFKKIEY